MLFCKIDLLDENMCYQRDRYVGIRDGRIAYIGTKRPQENFGECYDGNHKLLMPGFVNAHSHSPMTLLRGYAENLALADWLNTRVFPFESKLTDEAIHHGALLAAAEMLRFGVTSATDMYFGGQAICEAFLKAGLKINLSIAPTCSDQTDLWDLPEYREAREIYAEYHGAGEGRIKIDMSIHAEYTSTPKVVGQMAEAVKGLGADAVGMSTVPEVITAAHCGMRVLAISLISNMAAGVLDQPLDEQEVIDAGERKAKDLQKLVSAVIARLGGATDV